MPLCEEGKERRTVLGAKNKSFQAVEAKEMIAKCLLVPGAVRRIHLPKLRCSSHCQSHI